MVVIKKGIKILKKDCCKKWTSIWLIWTEILLRKDTQLSVLSHLLNIIRIMEFNLKLMFDEFLIIY
jgi:hypothetical protein